MSIKPSPKKETARIQIPSQPKDLPQATVRLQQTQPLTTGPANPARILPFSNQPIPEESDSMLLPLSIGAFVCALLAFLVQLWTFI